MIFEILKMQQKIKLILEKQKLTKNYILLLFLLVFSFFFFLVKGVFFSISATLLSILFKA
jgi:hypothetical protein